MSEPRTSERGLRIEKVSLVHHSGELDEYVFESGKLNILTGVRNSSKTTTLKVIDYCLGDRGSPADALKGAVASEHVEVSTDRRVDGRPYKLTRYFTHGRMGKIGINGGEIAAADFSDWILNELGWPNLLIPKGLHPTSATEQTPLSFRNPCGTSIGTRTPGPASPTRSRSSCGEPSLVSSWASPGHGLLKRTGTSISPGQSGA